MGRPKLRWSIRALLNLGSLSPNKAMSWACVQQARTDSFREVCKSFNSMYFPSPPSISSLPFNEFQVSPSDKEEKEREDQQQQQEDEEDCLGVPSSSSVRAELNPDESLAMEAISSQRLFFSPCTTKSIMKQPSLDDHPKQRFGKNGDEAAPAILDSHCLETEEASTENMGYFSNEALAMAMSSHDPYMDFRVSMEEMVEANGLKDWSCLQELLHCYLRLNEKKSHKIIILAFVDLLMSLASQEPCKELGHGRGCFPSCICLNEPTTKQ